MTWWLQQKPIIVKLVEPTEEKAVLSELERVLVGALGLSGVIILIAVLLGLVMAALLFWIRRLRSA